jgi:hypothetical protein
MALACSRRCLAASAVASAGSVVGMTAGKTRSRSTKAWKVAATTSPSWASPSTISFPSGSWANTPAGPTTAQATT